jgi:hypothetical protein
MAIAMGIWLTGVRAGGREVCSHEEHAHSKKEYIEPSRAEEEGSSENERKSEQTSPTQPATGKNGKKWGEREREKERKTYSLA